MFPRLSTAAAWLHASARLTGRRRHRHLRLPSSFGSVVIGLRARVDMISRLMLGLVVVISAFQLAKAVAPRREILAHKRDLLRLLLGAQVIQAAAFAALLARTGVPSHG